MRQLDTNTDLRKPADWRRNAALSGLAVAFLGLFLLILRVGTQSSEPAQKWAAPSPATRTVSAAAPMAPELFAANEAAQARWHQTQQTIKDSFFRLTAQRSIAMDNSGLASAGTFERTKFFSSVRYGDLKAVRKAIEHGVVDPNIAREGGSSPLMQAAFYGHKPLLQYLLSRKTEIDAKDPQGATALFFAVKGNHPEVVKFLISKGADPSATLATGETLEQVALKNRLPKMAKFLAAAAARRKVAKE